MSAPLALGAPIDGAGRNPEQEHIGRLPDRDADHRLDRPGQGRRRRQHRRLHDPPVQQARLGGGAIYGCRAKPGTESCVAANNLNNGDAFRFQTTPNAGAVGQIRFGLDISKPIEKPPFLTNGTRLVKNLNADQLDGQSAGDFVAKGSLLFAKVNADGTIGANRGVPANRNATVDTSGTDRSFTVPFSGDLSQCVATANPMAAVSQPLEVNTGSDKSTIVVEEHGDTDAYGFQLQVTC